MNLRRIVHMILVLLFILSGCSNSSTGKSVGYFGQYNNEDFQESYEESSDEDLKADYAFTSMDKDKYDINMRRDLLCLMMAYPGYIKKVHKESDNEVYIVMKSGSKILYDDKKQKNYDQKLANADLQDVLEINYPLGNITNLMEENYDPGRIRSYALLKEIYGSSRQQIEKNLEGVRAGGKVCSFNSSNGAADALEQAMKEIGKLAQTQNNVYSNIFPVNGTYNYRVIAGTGQLSPHAFGIAIDLKSDTRDYWKWASREQGQQRLNEYPREIVKLFEENNFVWGGKWAHFDILHFEYRPELIIKARYYIEEFEMIEPWHYGFPLEDDTVKSYIEIIDGI